MNTVFSWRDAIQNSSLASTTRLVLLNLSFYMDSQGGICYPSINRQAADTGLSARAVITHLQIAEKEGYIIKRTKRNPGSQWSHSIYFAVFPKNMKLKTAEDHLETPCEEDSLSPESLSEPERKLPVKEVHSTSPVNSPVSKDKKYKKPKSEKVSLAVWEENIGATLNHQMMKNWIETKKLCSVLVQEQIELFRTKMTAGDNRYANFVAAFQNYVLSGYLPKALSALARETSPHSGRGYHEKVQRGVSI